MKFSIGHRLFAAVVLSFLAVAAVGVELVRWKLADNFADYAPLAETARLDGLASALSAQYERRHDWSFLPADAARRKAWLREEFQRTAAPSDRATSSATLGDRLGLQDTEGRPLAGTTASPLLVALASIDTIARHLEAGGRPIGALVVARSQNPDDQLAVAFLLEQQRNLAIVAGVGILLAVLAAGLLAANFRQPVGRLVAGARLLEQGRFDVRLPTDRSDELGELAHTFNHLAARLEDTERSRRQWIADTSHELRTPLSVLRGQLEALQDGVRAATPDNLALMLRQVLGLAKLVDDLHELALPVPVVLRCDPVALDLWPLVEEAAAAFSEKARRAGLSLTLAPAPPRTGVTGDPARLRQVLVNLLENSVRYTTAGGRIEIGARVVAEALQVTIDDSSPGVPAPAMARLGERFFRVEPSRSRESGGSGLGLALSRQIAEAHGGRLEFGASPLGGLRAILVLRLVP